MNFTCLWKGHDYRYIKGSLLKLKCQRCHKDIGITKTEPLKEYDPNG